MTTRTIDSKGRLLLGKEFASQLVLIDDNEPGRLIIMPATAIPNRELWLYHNQEARASLERGLKQAKRREFVAGPNMKDADALAAEIDDQ